QHGQQIISVSAAPTIVHATAAASNNNGTVGGNVNVGVTAAAGATPTGAAAAAGTFGGKYVLVQRAAHIGDIVTPRAASAPPTHNQIQIHHVPVSPHAHQQQQQQQQQLHQQMSAVQQQQLSQQVVQHQLQQQQQHQFQQQQGQLQQIAAGANAVAPASLQAAITRRIPSTHVITYGQDDSGGTEAEDGAGTNNA
ncbi:AGAP011995-PA, partial [Anopheles gambiae str. PEST]